MGKGDTRTAAVGLAGALIGGLCSFAGAYFTIDVQRDQVARDEKRAAYVELLTANEAHVAALRDVALAIEAEDEAIYDEQVAARTAAHRAHYLAISKVWLVSDGDLAVYARTYDVLTALDLPPDIDPKVLPQIHDARVEANQVAKEMLAASRAELRDNT